MAVPCGNIDHIAIVVADMRQSVAFYRRHFGFAVERKFGNRELGVSAVVLKKNQSRIELFEYRDEKATYAKRLSQVHGARVPRSYFEPGIRHIAFRTRKFAAAVKGLKKQGLDPWIKPKTGYSGDSITFIQDPNGILLEIVSPLGRRKKKKAARK